MKAIPNTEQSPVLRTDFADEAAWESLRIAIDTPVGEFRPYVEYISDPAYDGLSTGQVLELIPQSFKHTFLFVVDRTALTHPDRPILVIDLYAERGRTFRVVPTSMWSVENNLSIANMDFEEFAEEVDDAGIFRGF